MSPSDRLTLPARPEPIDVDPARAAVVVVDLQNGYASPGGYRDLAGRDISGAQRVIENTLRILEVARPAGMTVLFLQNGWDPELREAGGEGSPNWHKSNPLKLMRQRPELRGKILTRGGWDYDFVDVLKPEPGDLIVPKPRYSGFSGTNLEALLRERDIRTLVFVGIATNVCVESTLRDAYFREYFCILIEDATQQAGPAFIQDATVYNVENFLGWISRTNDFCAALQPAK
jgi:ureidoacrylate peracid hydrolase